MDMRVGMGYDVHRLQEGCPLILGGVNIPWKRGLAGHSDADVLLHAVMDALLGAAALGDIGTHFPSDDPRFKGISSLFLLAKVGSRLTEAGFTVVNIDSTLVAQRPRLAPHIPSMCQNMARALELTADRISVKATTSEFLGFTGRQEGIAACAVALVTAGPRG